MQEILLKIRYFEKGLSKSFKKSQLYFSSEPSPFSLTKLLKTKGAWNRWPQLLFRLQSNFRKIPFFISYILSDLVWWCNIKWFLSYSKNYICKFMQANSWHHKLFHFHLSFWICKVVHNWLLSNWSRLLNWKGSGT